MLNGLDDKVQTLCYDCIALYYDQARGEGFDWGTEKDQLLRETRGVSFELVVAAIEQGGLLDVLEHPNQERYPGQLIYVIDMGSYAYLVPFVIQPDGTRFLKTIIPSRKATRTYSRRLR